LQQLARSRSLHVELANAARDVGDEAVGVRRDVAPEPGLDVAVPNYMQLPGIARAVGAEVERFRLRQETGWDVDWDESEKAVTPNLRLVYLSRPSNPTGSIFSHGTSSRAIRSSANREAT
jgi:aspartate/methionine/tyrosine aminotransferase